MNFYPKGAAPHYEESEISSLINQRQMLKVKKITALQKLDQDDLGGDNSLRPVPNTLPLANNFALLIIGPVGSGKTTLAIKTLENIGIDMIDFDDKGVSDRLALGMGSIEEYTENLPRRFNDGQWKERRPFLATYIVSPTSQYDKKFDQVGIPVITQPTLDIACDSILNHTNQWNRWWSTIKLLRRFNDVFTGKISLTYSPSEFASDMIRVLTSEQGLNNPQEASTNYNIEVIRAFISTLTSGKLSADFRNYYDTSMTKGQRDRLSQIFSKPYPYTEETPDSYYIRSVYNQAISKAHELNQTEGMRIRSPYYDEYFVHTRPRFFVIVDDQAGTEYFHKVRSSFAELVQKRRHYGVSFIITTQKWSALSPFVRSNLSDFYICGNNPVREIEKLYEDIFSNIFDSFDDFRRFYMRITADPTKPYTPLLYFKSRQPEQLRAGFSQVIEAYTTNDNKVYAF